MPTEINIYKAQGIANTEVPSATIIMETEIPARNLEAADTLFLDDATTTESLLYNTLPGGTYDQLLGLMLKRKASHFIIAHGGHDAR